MGKRTRTGAAVIALVSLLTQGCLAFMKKQYEKVPRADGIEEPVVAPNVAIRFASPDCGGQEWHEKVLAQMRQRHPLLANARFESAPPEDFSEGESAIDYIVQLTVESSEKSFGDPEITGYSLGLVPFAVKTRVTYTAVLLSEYQEEISTHTATLTAWIAGQLLLVWTLPLNLFLLANIHGERKLMRRLLSLVEADIRQDLARRDPKSTGADPHFGGTTSHEENGPVRPSSGRTKASPHAPPVSGLREESKVGVPGDGRKATVARRRAPLPIWTSRSGCPGRRPQAEQGGRQSPPPDWPPDV